jgi:hypothetical protein
MPRRCVVFAVLVGIAALTSSTAGFAATRSIALTATCTDGGGAVWTLKSVWGPRYKARHGATRVHTYTTAFTTNAPAAKSVDYAIRTYSGAGRLLQTLHAHGRAFDFKAGGAWLKRNVINPVSAPGKARITVKVGAGNDGKAGCLVTFKQPKKGSLPAKPAKPATPATPAKPATPATPAKPATPATPAKPATPPAPPVKPATPPAPPVNPAEPPSAAAAFGWGPVIGGDEFNYVGSVDPSRWTDYNGPGNAGKGTRSENQVKVDGSVVTITGTSNGTTGGFSAKFDNRMFGRWETRMRVSDRDSEYHPVLILRPVAGSDSCAQEIDYSEASSDTALDHFFNHYSCSNQQTSVAKAIDMTQWHNYAVQVTPAGVVGYIDGVEWFRDAAHLPTTAMHQTIQLDWFPDGSATRESWLQVDWMRFYN